MRVSAYRPPPKQPKLKQKALTHNSGPQPPVTRPANSKTLRLITMAASSPVRVASLAAALVFALLLAAAEPARASCRQIGNADYCVGDGQVRARQRARHELASAGAMRHSGAAIDQPQYASHD